MIFLAIALLGGLICAAVAGQLAAVVILAAVASLLIGFFALGWVADVHKHK